MIVERGSGPYLGSKATGARPLAGIHGGPAVQGFQTCEQT